MLDRLRPERREQRLIHRSEAPRAQGQDQQFRNARHKSRNPVAGLHTRTSQEIREPRRVFSQLLEGIGLATSVGLFPEQRDPARLRVPIATFNASIQAGLEIAGKLGCDLLGLEPVHETLVADRACISDQNVSRHRLPPPPLWLLICVQHRAECRFTDAMTVMVPCPTGVAATERRTIVRPQRLLLDIMTATPTIALTGGRGRTGPPR